MATQVTNWLFCFAAGGRLRPSEAGACVRVCVRAGA